MTTYKRETIDDNLQEGDNGGALCAGQPPPASRGGLHLTAGVAFARYAKSCVSLFSFCVCVCRALCTFVCVCAMVCSMSLIYTCVYHVCMVCVDMT